jgi:general secretion pathway protein G
MAMDGWDGETLQFFPLFFSRQLTKVPLIACRPAAAPRQGVSAPRAISQRGFTLIEIMVVVFILGLLVTLVAPKILGRTDEAKRTKAAADLRAIEQALHLYKLDNGNYPSTDQGLKALVSKPESGIIPARWNPEGYLEKVPVDPWGHPYLYLSNGERYTLKSLGADGEEGGEGKYADLDSHDL